jgi:hypothetical protein
MQINLHVLSKSFKNVHMYPLKMKHNAASNIGKSGSQI